MITEAVSSVSDSEGLPSPLRVCLLYDCLFPFTVGGAERWYRNLGERLASEGHEVDYLTLRQWDTGVEPDVPGVRVRTVGPRMRLYAGPGRRRILPPLVFGVGVLLHLLRFGRRYDVVHTASFPYFSLLAAGALRRLGGYRLVVDWHEVWSRTYWREYLGRPGGDIGWVVQRLCARIPQRAFCFSQLHASRLLSGGLRGEVTTLPGEYAGPTTPTVDDEPRDEAPTVVFAGRHIPEKRVTAIPPALREARRRLPDLRGLILGDGPERAEVVRLIHELALDDVVAAPGFVAGEAVDDALARALCLLLPSRREGYGMVVVEAARHGTPSIVVAGEDNAATELIWEGVNGLVVSDPDPVAIAEAVTTVAEEGVALRARTADWYARHAERLSLESSVRTVLTTYFAR